MWPIEAADVTLSGGDLSGLVTAIALSKATMRNIRQNLGFAFGYNALGIPIAAGILYPVIGLLLSPMIAAAAMAAQLPLGRQQRQPAPPLHVAPTPRRPRTSEPPPTPAQSEDVRDVLNHGTLLVPRSPEEATMATSARNGTPKAILVAIAACCAGPMVAIIVLTMIVGVTINTALAVTLGFIAAAVCVALMVQRHRTPPRPSDGPTVGPHHRPTSPRPTP
jgi:hypothetical protein